MSDERARPQLGGPVDSQVGLGPTSRRPVSSRQPIDDRPAGRDDLLDARPLAAGIDALLRRQFVATAEDRDPDSTIAINVDAAWGRGKSTLLRKIQDLDEDARGGEPPWISITFDAWRHSRTSPIWWAMTQTLRHGVAQERSWWGRLRLEAAEIGRRALATIGLIPPLVVFAGGLALWLLGWNLIDLPTIAAGLLVIAGAGTSLRRFVRGGGGPEADALSTTGLTPLGQAAEHVLWLRSQATRSRHGGAGPTGRPILFIIEELDRCPQEVVVEVLDSMHTLMRASDGRVDRTAANIVFAVLADASWIRAAYQGEGTGPVLRGWPGATFGAQFHAKLFNLVLTLPPITPRQHLRYAAGVLAQARGTDLEEAADAIAGASESPATPRAPATGRVRSARHDPLRRSRLPIHWGAPRIDAVEARRGSSARALAHRQRHILEDYGSLLPRNPRAVKRVVNDWAVHDLVRSHLQPAERLVDDVLIRWVILCHMWPELAERLLSLPALDTPERIDSASLTAHLEGDSCPLDLVDLLASDAVRRVWPMCRTNGPLIGPYEGEMRWIEAVAILAGQYPPVGQGPDQRPVHAR